MNEAITPALIFAVIGAAGIVYGWIKSSNDDSAEVLERLTRLETKLDGLADQVERHNQVVERTFKLESDTNTAFKRIDEHRQRIERLENR